LSLHRLSDADRAPAVGRDTEAWCTRCKRELGHTITAMNGPEIVQVRCSTCGSVHRYRSETVNASARKAASSSKPAKPRAPSAAVKAATAARESAAAKAHRRRYEELMAGLDLGAALPYAPSLSPDAGALLAHGTFGHGVVERVESGKALVLFADVPRLLVIGR
jgi:hypothetical protein